MSDMVDSTISADSDPLRRAAAAPEATPRWLARLFELPGPADGWNRTTCGALAALVVIWAVQFYATWAAWGNLTIDSGHEAYIPALLAEGKVLYRDVWFMYGPAAPYFNSYLFRLFGAHLNVLYWAGSLSALACAILLYLTGMRLSRWMIGWTAGAVVLMEAFQPSLFCFPFPYSFAAVYGSLSGCLFIWLAIRGWASRAWFWMFAAATTAAAAVLIKPEFGMACYGTLAVLVAVRFLREWSWTGLARDAALAVPGVLACLLVVRWMVSIAGVEFITQENLVFWPSSYFMQTFGKMWLERNGFTVSAAAFGEAAMRSIPLAGVMLVGWLFLRWKRSDTRAIVLRVMLALLVIVYIANMDYLLLSARQIAMAVLSAIFFPRDMVLYIAAVCLLCLAYLLSRPRDVSPEVPLLLIFSSLVAFRILMKMTPADYPIYYNGPVVLCFLLLVTRIIPRDGRSRTFAFAGESIICLACLSAVMLYAIPEQINAARAYVPLVTERGTVRTWAHLVKNYEAAIPFMREKAAAGESVMSVPEDTSLYFLSGTYAPTRVFSLTPGIVAPGKMTDKFIEEIERKPVRYLLWSNRTFSEFGVPIFGQHFYREIADHLKSHYQPVGPLTPLDGPYWQWHAVVWERKPEGERNKR